MSPLKSPRLTSEAARIARFLAVGMVGLTIDSAIFMLLFMQGADRPFARAASLALATCATWLLNRRLTFAASGRGRRVEFGRYGLVALGAQGFNYTLFLSLSALSPAVHPLALIVACAGITAVLSYAGQRLFTFAAAPRPAH